MKRYQKCLGVCSGALALVLVMGIGTSEARSLRRECEDYAHRQAASYDRGDDVLGGAIVGGVGGALIGGIAGGRRGVAPGAIVGSGVGALSGAAGSDSKRRRVYREAYNDCMDRAEYRRSSDRYDDRPRSGAPKPWTRSWYEYCADRYRSFNPRTGYYVPYVGARRFCGE